MTKKKLWALLSYSGSLLLLNFTWLVFSLPIITIEANSAAFMHELEKITKEQCLYSFSSYFLQFKKGLRTGIPLMVAYLFLFVPSRVILSYYGQRGILGMSTVGISIGILLIALLLFPHFSLSEPTPLLNKKLIEVINRLVQYFFKSILNLLSSILVIYLVFYYFSLLLPILPVIVGLITLSILKE